MPYIKVELSTDPPTVLDDNTDAPATIEDLFDYLVGELDNRKIAARVTLCDSTEQENRHVGTVANQ